MLVVHLIRVRETHEKFNDREMVDDIFDSLAEGSAETFSTGHLRAKHPRRPRLKMLQTTT